MTPRQLHALNSPHIPRMIRPWVIVAASRYTHHPSWKVRDRAGEEPIDRRCCTVAMSRLASNRPMPRSAACFSSFSRLLNLSTPDSIASETIRANCARLTACWFHEAGEGRWSYRGSSAGSDRSDPASIGSPGIGRTKVETTILPSYPDATRMTDSYDPPRQPSPRWGP